ncbi:retrovirus-related pol polyprotein from transposon TNT 1-94 [Tanacetum coccineum]
MKMEILLEPTSNKLMVEHAEFDESNTHVLERFYTSAGNPVKEILLKLNLPDHRKLKDGGEVKEFQISFRHSDTERLSRSDEVLKLKNFKKDATLKLFKSTNQERLFLMQVSLGGKDQWLRHRSNFSTLHAQFLVAVTMGNEPTHFTQAITNPNWHEAMSKEIDDLERNDTWVLEDFPNGKKVIGCKRVYKIKYNSDGTIE